MLEGILKNTKTNELDLVSNPSAGNGSFPVFDAAELVVGIVAPNCAEYTRKQVDELTEWIKRPQIGAKGLVYIRNQVI